MRADGHCHLSRGTAVPTLRRPALWSQNCAMLRRIRILLYLALAVPLLGGPASVPAPENWPSVLILQSLDAQASPYAIRTQLFRERLQSHVDVPISFAEISLDASWGGRKDREPYQIKLIRNRIASEQPDLVVTMGPSAIDFWLRNRKVVPVRIPVLMVSRQSYLDPAILEPGDAGVVSTFAFKWTVDAILELLPETRHIVVAFGASELERDLTIEAEKDLERFGDRLRFSYTSELGMPEIEALVQALPKNSAVLFGMLSIDAEGLILPLNTALERIAEASSAPVFGVFDLQLGHGIVGGRLIPTDRMAQAMATEALELLENPAKAPIVRVVPPTEPTYDWRELRKWRIDTRALPPDSRILFREPRIWERYVGWLLLGGALLAAQTATIGMLLVHRRRRFAAELAGTRLSSRLISAHEDERSRLARELHDDLSQRLAGLSIDAALLLTGTPRANPPETLRRMHAELVRLGKDVHDMSYQLHPSIVGELGLVTALRTEVDRMRRQTGKRVENLIEDVDVLIPRETALCLYRIAQEALQNVVKHADASLISVTLRKIDDSLVLEIRDDGKGFDSRKLPFSSGIGISGMMERAHLAGGRLKVVSQPGRGTTIIAEVPSGGARHEQDQGVARR